MVALRSGAGKEQEQSKELGRWGQTPLRNETRPGTYSASVYDVPDPCDRFIKSLKGKIREKYPRPVIRIGQTGHGLSVHTMDYDDDYTDPNHIDWWIFKEEMQEAARAFEVYDGTQNMEQ